MSKRAQPKKTQKQEKQKRKNKKQSQQQQNQSGQQDEVFEENSGEDDQNDEDDGDDDDEDDQSSSSQVKIDPSKFAIKDMKFRDKRGTKMNYLMNRKKEEQDDPFWIDNKGYFGDPDGNDDDEESYVQSSSGRDYFDSDFDQTQSDHNDDQNDGAKPQEIDEQKEKERKRRHQLMLKIKNPQAPQPKKPEQVKGNKNQKKQLFADQVGRKYIHQVCTQEQLLGQAAHTQYFNWLSYRKLISLQTVKKDYSKKKHHIQGSKVIYRDKIMANGQRKVTYQLNGVQVKSIKDLNDVWNS